MNRKGQTAILLIMLGVVVLLLAIYLAPSLNEVTSGARNETFNGGLGLNCSGIIDSDAGVGNISTGTFQKANCLAVDLFTPYFIGSMIAIGGGIIGAKIYFNSQ